MKQALLIGLALALSLPGMVGANSLNLSDAQERLINKRLSDQFRMTRLRAEEAAAERDKALANQPLMGGSFQAIARSAARRHGIPVELFEKLVTAESNWNPDAVSHAGAIGLAQLMPGTARYLGVDPRDPRQNLEGGARYLAEQFRRFGTWELALAAYNAGPEAVERYGGIPPYKETRNYVVKILRR